MKASADPVPLDFAEIRLRVRDYLDSDFVRYPPEEDQPVYGIIVHDYLSMYLECLKDGRVPTDRMDRRTFRLLWEHKRCMGDRITAVEQALGLSDTISRAYAPLVKVAERMRFIYAKYNLKPEPGLLTILQKKLLELKGKEENLLAEFLERMSAA